MHTECSSEPTRREAYHEYCFYIVTDEYIMLLCVNTTTDICELYLEHIQYSVYVKFLFNLV
jgi:hypothetical protein